MPAAAFAPLHFYGPGCASAVGNDVTPTASATLRANGRLVAVGTAVASSPLARATQGRTMAAVNTSAAFSPFAQLRGNARMVAVGKIGTLSQDDVTGAVLESEIEPGISLRRAMRALLSTAALGRSNGGGTDTLRFRNPGNTKDRITATVDANGNRTNVVADLD